MRSIVRPVQRTQPMASSVALAGSDPQLPDDVVQELNREIERQVRHFHLETPFQDAVNTVWFELLRRSDRLGTSLLERYDPGRGPLVGYVRVIAHCRLQKLFNKERHRRKAMAAFAVAQTAEAESAGRPVHPHRLGPDGHLSAIDWQIPDSSTSNYIDEMLSEFDIERLYHALRDTRHARVTRRGPSGEGLSNLQVLRCILTDRMDTNEIAEHFGVSVSEIRRRKMQLREEPLLQALRQG